MHIHNITAFHRFRRRLSFCYQVTFHCRYTKRANKETEDGGKEVTQKREPGFIIDCLNNSIVDQRLDIASIAIKRAGRQITAHLESDWLGVFVSLIRMHAHGVCSVQNLLRYTSWMTLTVMDARMLCICTVLNTMDICMMARDQRRQMMPKKREMLVLLMGFLWSVCRGDTIWLSPTLRNILNFFVIDWR